MTNEIAKYIRKNFFNDDAYREIHVQNDIERDECLQFLEDSGILWLSGDRPTKWRPASHDFYITVGNNVLTWDNTSLTSNFVEWADLTKIISLFET